MITLFSRLITATLFFFLISSSFFLTSEQALAVDASSYAPSSSFASDAGLPTNNQSPTDIVINGIRLVMQILGVISLVLIIYAGIVMLTSAGNSEKISKAKDILVWTVIGAIVILSSLGILEFLDNTLFK